MVEFNVVINDGDKAYNTKSSDRHSNALIGKKIQEEVDGIYANLPGYRLKVTGGSDTSGFPMRWDVNSEGRKKILADKGAGFKNGGKGVRRKRWVHGNQIDQNIAQINMKVIKKGARSIEELLKK